MISCEQIMGSLLDIVIDLDTQQGDGWLIDITPLLGEEAIEISQVLKFEMVNDLKEYK